ncbi:MAG: hypothetical protein HN826_04955 [Methylococcales bacterium]|jgi:hypothetical protein|nr:hypothetical protein [Methylococcales bacterium]
MQQFLKKFRFIGVMLAIFAISACGGSGGGSDSTSTTSSGSADALSVSDQVSVVDAQ